MQFLKNPRLIIWRAVKFNYIVVLKNLMTPRQDLENILLKKTSFNDVEILKKINYIEVLRKCICKKSMFNDVEILKNLMTPRSLENISFNESTFNDLEVPKNLIISR